MTTPPRAPGRRCLVTGGAGFIGSHLVDHLAERGDEVTVVDDLSTGSERNIAGRLRSGAARLIRAGLVEALPGLDIASFDQVYHLAAAVGVRRIIERPIESIETNILTTSELLRAVALAQRDGRRPPAVLIASSSEVYGKSAKSPFSEDDDCLYGPTTAARWSYACSKAIDEYLALAHHRRSGMPVVVVRFFNTVGPRQTGEHGMVLPSFIGEALAGRPPRVFGDGAQTRCFCDVRDAAPALPLLLENPRCHGRVFNLGSDRPITMLELARLVVSTLGLRVQPVLVPYDDAYGPGFEDLLQRRPDLRRVREAIGFRPRIELTQTIADIARSPADPASPAAAAQAAPPGGVSPASPAR